MHHNVLHLTKFLFLFFTRRLLARGIMQYPGAKWIIAGGVTLAYGGYCALVYYVVQGMILNESIVNFVIKTFTVTSSLWVILFFMIVRILFMKADKLIELTHTLPVTNKQRTLAYTIFEAVTVFTGVAIVCAPLVACLSFKGGVIVLPDLFFGIIAQIIVLYLLVDAFYLCLERVFILLNLTRWRSFLIPSVLAVLIVLTYKYVEQETQALTDAFFEQKTHYGYSHTFVWIYDNWGVFAAVGAAVGVILGILALILLLAPNRHLAVKQFFKFPLGTKMSLFACYIRAYLRPGEFLLSTLFVLAFSIFVYFIPGNYPPYWLGILSMQGVYALSNTESLRRSYRFKISPLAQYGYFFGAYLLIISVVAVPVLIAYALKGLILTEIFRSIAICLFSLISAICVSIFFPAEKHNPFAILIGFSVAIALMGSIGFALIMLSLPEKVTMIVWLILAAIGVFYSVLGIANTQKKEYYDFI